MSQSQLPYCMADALARPPGQGRPEIISPVIASSGTVAGANTRRYHALLLTARKPPCERFMLVNHLDEWLVVDGQTIPLSTNLYPNAIHPEGYKQCIGFTTDPWPTWTYNCHGTVVQREVFACACAAATWS